MSTTTPYLNLLKPDGGELVDEQLHLNNNFDKIDEKALSHDGRINTLEGAAGVSPWLSWVPVLKIAGGASTLATTVTYADYFKLGELITINLDLTITSATATWPGANGTKLLLKLPFKIKNKMVMGNAILFRPATEHVVMAPAWSDNDTMFLAPIQSSGVIVTIPGVDNDLLISNGNTVRVCATYRTSGIAVP